LEERIFARNTKKKFMSGRRTGLTGRGVPTSWWKGGGEEKEGPPEKGTSKEKKGAYDKGKTTSSLQKNLQRGKEKLISKISPKKKRKEHEGRSL